MRAQKYTREDTSLWNSFVEKSSNGTFLIDRNYMDYHADRFEDASYLFYKNDDLIALLPASRAGDRLESHGGLTYGGLVLCANATIVDVLNCFDALCKDMSRRGFRSLLYKTIPHIYHTAPSEADRYALFRMGAKQVRCDPITVVPPGGARVTTMRRRWLKKALKREDLKIGPSQDWRSFWAVLSHRLQEKHAVQPTHTLEEISALANAFPEHIQLLTARRGDDCLGGTVLYMTRRVVHAQYIAGNELARDTGALDLTLATAIEMASDAGKSFSFGISTTNGGAFLNEGLAAYKESFGGRTISHDFFQLDDIQ